MSTQNKITLAIGLTACLVVIVLAVPEIIRIFNIMFTTATVETCEAFQNDFGVKVELYRGEGVNYHRYFYMTENAGAEWEMVLDSFEDSTGWRDNCSRLQFAGDDVAIMPFNPHSHSSFLLFA